MQFSNNFYFKVECFIHMHEVEIKHVIPPKPTKTIPLSFHMSRVFHALHCFTYIKTFTIQEVNNSLCMLFRSVLGQLSNHYRDIFWPEGLGIAMFNCQGNLQFNLRSYNQYCGLKSSSIFPHVSLLSHSARVEYVFSSRITSEKFLFHFKLYNVHILTYRLMVQLLQTQ